MSQNQDTMETVGIRIYYDFASTLCYVSHRVMSGVESQIIDLGVELEWRPIDLTVAAPWDRGDSFAPEIRTAVRNTGLALGIDVEMPDPWLDSRPAAQVALSTSSASTEALWRREVFVSFFELQSQGLTPKLVELAKELVGPDSLPDEEQGFRLVEESTSEAMSLGVAGVPTILLDNWMLGGVYDGESMVSILRQLSEHYRDRGRSAIN